MTGRGRGKGKGCLRPQQRCYAETPQLSFHPHLSRLTADLFSRNLVQVLALTVPQQCHASASTT